MKIKLIILCAGLFVFANVNAQSKQNFISLSFNEVDRNGDSLIELNEMNRAYLGKVTRTGTPVNTENLFKSKDLNEDGVLDETEFSHQGIKPIINSNKKGQKELSLTSKNKEKSFERMDVNQDGVVVIDEMVKFFKNKKNKNGKEIKAKKLFKFRDKNKDGKITIEEFLNSIDNKK
ncbi:EF-hand domain-containing protein [Lutibacter citreus]|uniref:EF-hand domain-containing protein n=1 Tax=Lutibacter citreus TaxID=2138210 RepID=UPI000DBE9EBA|nr:EF-hand domain-containing protein [Lutibacter citreus]